MVPHCSQNGLSKTQIRESEHASPMIYNPLGLPNWLWDRVHSPHLLDVDDKSLSPSKEPCLFYSLHSLFADFVKNINSSNTSRPWTCHSIF